MAEDERQSYSTGEAARLLGISFRTLKRWIYSGKISAEKTPSGRYRISSEEIDRLRKEAIDELASETIELVSKKRVAYLRELQVCLEDKYSHTDTYDKLKMLCSTGRLNTISQEGRWFFPVGVEWEDVVGLAQHKSELIKVYQDHPKRFELEGIVYADYSKYL